MSPLGTGRSAYVCPSVACVGALDRKGSLERALKTKLTRDDLAAISQLCLDALAKLPDSNP